MTEKIKTDAVLCALPDEPYELMRMMSIFLRHKGLETLGAHNREEMLALLESHTFRGMITVSSWLPEEEVMAGIVKSVKEIPIIILVEPQHYGLGRLTSIEVKTNHEWITIPFDIEELFLRVSRWP